MNKLNWIDSDKCPKFHYLFKKIGDDGSWLAISFNDMPMQWRLTFNMLLDILEVDIPDYISYCLIKTDNYKIKYRAFGNTRNIYITQLCD